MTTKYAEFRDLTPQGVQDLIEARPETDEDEGYSSYEWNEWEVGQAKEYGGYRMTLLDRVAHSDEVSAIFVVPCPEPGYNWAVRYFRKQGYYNSYESVSEWDGDIYEVRPQQETVTVWREVKQ